MKFMTADQLREAYLKFFARKGHHVGESASLVPHGDPTLLLTSAGMVPFKPYFLGLEAPKYTRITTCQRCVRTGDIDNVGRTDRHHTFFEMLGNFSFGDYFKREAIQFAWEFVTKELEFDPERLWTSVYLEDDEAYDIWNKEIGIPEERIVRLGKDDNFWQIGVGPCGPCSEIYFDKGPEHGCGREGCAPGCDFCERYLEIWNLVFIQFHQDEEGRLTPLKSKGVDTGMGLERTASLLQRVESNFAIDLIAPIVRHIAEVSGVPYGNGGEADVSVRVITDHMRGVTFMVADGILPGNEGRGYVLRRLLRRSVRHAKLLGIEGSFLPGVVDRVIDLMKAGYPYLEAQREYIGNIVATEEARFHETLDQGMEILDKMAARLGESGVLPGEDAFRLYDTYGFPVELTAEILKSRGLELDTQGFEQAMQAQRERARRARGQMGYLGDLDFSYGELDLGVKHTPFVGYDSYETETKLIGLIVEGEQAGRATTGEEVEAILAETPFYPEGGGQVPDTGVIVGPSGRMRVESVSRVGDGLIVHRGRIESGSLQVGDAVRAAIDVERRKDTARNHTATHLMHKALHEVLGDHANQAGSLVAPDRLRFDFTHFKPLTKHELAEIERRVNERILENLPVVDFVTEFDKAKALGAMALFGEKYGERVRVVKVGDYSIELCGGTHVKQSADIGIFRIVQESGVAAGVRRIEAVTARGALKFLASRDEALREAADRLQVAPADLPKQVEKLLAALKEQERQIEQLKGRLAQAQVGSLLAQAEDFGGIKVLAAHVDGLDIEGLRALGDRLKAQMGAAVIILGSSVGGKVQMVAMATDGAADRSVDVKKALTQAAALVGGGGGGNSRMAQAGGKDPSRLKEALEDAKDRIVRQLYERTASEA